jgi:L-malate glycosyltransferase
MKVLAIDHNAVLARDRGLYRALQAKHDMEVTLLVPFMWKDPFGRAVFEPEDADLRVLPSRVLFEGKPHRLIYARLREVMSSFRPDLIFFNAEPESFLALQAITLRWTAARHAKIIMESWRNMEYDASTFPVKWPWLSAFIERMALSSANGIVVHNRKGVEIFAAREFKEARCIPAAVDTSMFFPQAASSAAKERPEPVLQIGYVGRLVQEKGVDTLLRAVFRLGFRWELGILGEGPQKQSLIDLARELGISDRVQWMKTVSHPEVAQILRMFDVLVLPSTSRKGWTEQFGRVLIEAMACGVAVVGSDSGEIPRVIGGAGYIFPQGDVEALTAVLSRLHYDPFLRSQLVEKGLTRTRTHFSADVVSEQHAEFFREIHARR